MFFALALVSAILLSGCGSSNDSEEISDVNDTVVSDDTSDVNNSFFTDTHAVHNKAAYIPSQCYTKTVDDENRVHNPCFACHINSVEPNYINDPDLQEEYAMSEYSKVNRFTNLFKDRTQEVTDISDSEILTYIRKDNYKDENTLTLAQKLQNVPAEWDVNANGKWDGYTPDCYFNFDDEGFDKDPNGEHTGWRAFAYYPFLGTFWPTNGSTDDVIIRLPEVFRQDAQGNFNLTIYKINLAIVEALVKQKDITIDEVDETSIGVDLDQNGDLTTATMVKFNWVKPTIDTTTWLLTDFSMHYVGKAKELLLSNEYLIAPGLYPKGTQFLHSVRYIDVEESSSDIKMALRMKELRYAKKTHWNTYAQLQNASLNEIKDKDAFPDRLRTILGNTEDGLQNGLGWIYQGFIEDDKGELRPQNYEETLNCIGCHSGVGATADTTFAFQRKFEFEDKKRGWYHWTQDTQWLKDIAEPLTRDGRGEYTLYLEENHAGDEFRDNEEIISKFFEPDGTLIASEAAKVQSDISYLLAPSVERALMLNKAYKVIVDEQSYIYGRDAHLKPVTNVHEEVEIGESTQIESIVF